MRATCAGGLTDPTIGGLAERGAAGETVVVKWWWCCTADVEPRTGYVGITAS